MSAEKAASALERGRALYARRAWADALEALDAAERTAPLDAEDMERLATCASYLAREERLFKDSERAYELYRASGRNEAAARCAYWLGTRLLHLGEVGRGSAWLARAQQLIDQHAEPSVLSGYLLISAASRHLNALEFDAVEERCTRAAVIAANFRDSALEALVQSMLGRVLLRRGEVDRGLGLLDLSVLTASGEGIPSNVAGIVYCAAISNCHRVFALDRAREWTRTLARFCDAQPQLVVFSGTCLVHCSEVHQVCGDWQAATDEAERACTRAPPPPAIDKGPLANALYQRAELKRVAGDFAAAEELYRSACEVGRDPQPGLALLRLAQGKLEDAAVAIRRALSAIADPLDRLRLLPAAVEILLGAEQLDEARPLVAELEAHARGQSMEVVRAMAAHARGALCLAEDDAEGALGPLRTSFEAWLRVGAPYLAARVRVELAAACQKLGDRDGAEFERAAARGVFEKLGARHDLARLDAPAPRATESGLSSRELGVLRLVAAGKTNRAIAAELSLSEKTIDRHVSNIFAKLNVNTRAAATAYAYQHRLA